MTVFKRDFYVTATYDDGSQYKSPTVYYKSFSEAMAAALILAAAYRPNGSRLLSISVDVGKEYV